MIANSHASVRLLLSYIRARILFSWEQTFNAWNRQVRHARVSMAALNQSIAEMEEAAYLPINLIKLVSSSDIKTNASEEGEGFLNDGGSLNDSMINEVEMLPGFHAEYGLHKIQSDKSEDFEHYGMLSGLIRERKRAVTRRAVSAEPRR